MIIRYSLFKAAAAAEVTRRKARLDTKLANRNQRRPPHQRPTQSQQQRSNNPAPVRSGVSYANAVQPATFTTTSSTPAPAPVESNSADILAMLRSIQAEISAICQQQLVFETKFNELAREQTRLTERLDSRDLLYDDDAMYDDNVSYPPPNPNDHGQE